MTRLSIIGLVLTALVVTPEQVKNIAHNMEPFGARLSQMNIKDRLQIRPPPMNGFNVNGWLGPWIYQFHKAPCSWAISDDFTDYSQVLSRQGRIIVTQDTMRNRNVCNKLTSLLTITGPGEFSGKDLSGDNWSGVIIVVATDYTRFSVAWGCTKWSTFDQLCVDPYIYVKTRQLKVPADVLRQVESVLLNLFGISIKELTRVRHGKPCPRGVKQG